MKVALYLVCNNSAVLMANVLIYSFKKHNPWFKGDIVVLHDNDECTLSSHAKSIMRIYHDSIKFQQIDTKRYITLFKRIRRSCKAAGRFRTLPCLYKWEMFKSSEYDRIIYLDTDCLSLNSLKGAIDYSDAHNFIAAPDSVDWDMEKFKGHYPPGHKLLTKNNELNGGFYIAGGDYMSDDFFNELIRHAESTDFKKFYRKLGKGRIGEQALLSNFIHDKDYYVLSSEYNRIRRVIPDDLLEKKPDLLNKIKTVHYTSGKPTTSQYDKIRLKGKWRSYKKINDIWRDYHEEATALYPF